MYDIPNGFMIPFNTYFQKILIKTNNRLISVSIWYMISFENNTQSVMTCKYPPLFYNQFLKRYCKTVPWIYCSIHFQAVHKIRDYVLQRIYQFRRPMTNYQIPQNALLKFRYFIFSRFNIMSGLFWTERQIYVFVLLFIAQVLM